VALDARHLLASALVIRPTGSCPFCFRQIGLRGAVLTLDPDGDVSFTRWTPRWPSWTGRVVWGTGLARDGGRLVMYGLSPAGLARDLYVATSTPADARRGRWRLDPRPVAHGVDPAGVTPYRDAAGWHVVTLRGTDVVRLDAARPGGPFTATTLARVPAGTAAHLYYAAAAHPEATLAGGGLLVTVCQNWLDGRTRPLARYRPRYLAVPPARTSPGQPARESSIATEHGSRR
jgi:hypothetical protein